MSKYFLDLGFKQTLIFRRIQEPIRGQYLMDCPEVDYVLEYGGTIEELKEALFHVSACENLFRKHNKYRYRADNVAKNNKDIVIEEDFKIENFEQIRTIVKYKR